jgi:hypothetical protein
MPLRLSCPSCGTHLNPREDLVLAAVNRGQKALLLLHPEPGNYRMAISHGFPLEKGDVVELFCPLCQADLKSPLDPTLVQLDSTSREGDEKGFVVFSRVFGDHATFVVTRGSVSSYGENAKAYEKRGLFIGLRLQ